MGSLNSNQGYLAAFTGQPFPNGLDLGRCMIQHDLGIFTADPAATFLQGQLVTKAATGIQPCPGKGVIGIAKWNKALTLQGVNVDEAIVLAGVVATNLRKSNVVGTVAVRSAPGMTGTTYTLTTDYTVNAVNGQVTRVAAGAITDGQTVYVTYTYQLASSDLDFQGRNFWNFTDDVSIQNNAVTVVTGWTMLFTTQYVAGRTYSLAGPSSNLYCAGGATDTDAAGLFTNNANAGGNEFVGRVMQLPTATDPYMGVIFGGMPAVQ